jgi:hypothetical protein
VVAVLGKAERGEQRIERSIRRLRRGEAHILLDRAPRQQPRLLENDAEPAVRWQFDATFEIASETDDDARSVVLPQPDGPTSATTSPLRRLIASSPSTRSSPPEAER